MQWIVLVLRYAAFFAKQLMGKAVLAAKQPFHVGIISTSLQCTDKISPTMAFSFNQQCQVFITKQHPEFQRLVLNKKSAQHPNHNQNLSQPTKEAYCFFAAG